MWVQTRGLRYTDWGPGRVSLAFPSLGLSFSTDLPSPLSHPVVKVSVPVYGAPASVSRIGRCLTSGSHDYFSSSDSLGPSGVSCREIFQ